MPDWSYRTIFRPVLFRLPFETARSIAFGFLGRLARLPGGSTVIDLMGHMAPDERLQTVVGGLTLASSVGCSCLVDPQLRATKALSHFGFGVVEVGPVSLKGDHTSTVTRWDSTTASLLVDTTNNGISPDRLIQKLPLHRPCRASIWVRVVIDAQDSIDTVRNAIQTLAPHADAFTIASPPVRSPPVATGRSERSCEPSHILIHKYGVQAYWEAITNPLAEHSKPWFLVIDDDNDPPPDAIVEFGCAGVLVETPQRGDPQRGEQSDTRRFGPRAFDRTLSVVTRLRPQLPMDFTIIAGGIHEPIDAFRAKQAGADVAWVDSGLVFSGPGLPKRINDALLSLQHQQQADANRRFTVSHSAKQLGSQAWFWTLLLAVAMLLGGLMAVIIASTRVVMPYDEHFVGMTRQQLDAINPRLLDFMTHDRVTLSGTMLSVGVLYAALSWWGLRRGHHWARVAVLASSFVGFCSFFLFLGFGYFDPLHAFVTAILFQFVLLAMHSESPPPKPEETPNLTNNRTWQRAQWGQLLFIVHGAVLIVAGLTISSFGVTTVFVEEDLEFMQTTVERLCGPNPRLLPLVAHDRASFGGMLIACGVTVLLSSLWGFRQRTAWLWWALLIGGAIAYGLTIAVHLSVGYTDAKHLAPAYGGLALLLFSSWLTHGYLVRGDAGDLKRWKSSMAASAGGTPMFFGQR